MQGAIQEAELRAKLAQGGTITDCAVVHEQPAGIGGDFFIPFFKCSWTKGWVPLARYRGKGWRSWRDFRTLHSLLGEWGYQGRIVVYRRADPALAKLGLTERDDSTD